MRTTNHPRSLLAMAGAAAGIASVLIPATAQAAPVQAPAEADDLSATALGPVHAAARDWAYRELQDPAHNKEVPLGSNCNFYAGVFGTGSAPGCPSGFRSEAWCADFAKYVWKNAGANVSGLDASTESFKTYGLNHGTWHPTLAGIRPGDVAIFDDDNDPTRTYHVGVVVEVGASGVDIVSGNVQDRVYKHDINYGDFNGDFIGYVAPVAR